MFYLALVSNDVPDHVDFHDGVSEWGVVVVQPADWALGYRHHYQPPRLLVVDVLVVAVVPAFRDYQDVFITGLFLFISIFIIIL